MMDLMGYNMLNLVVNYVGNLVFYLMDNLVRDNYLVKLMYWSVLYDMAYSSNISRMDNLVVNYFTLWKTVFDDLWVQWGSSDVDIDVIL
jgi:hypothetical protein